MKQKIIVYAESFDENSGGSIALHRLCDLLNREGAQARLWPWIKPVCDPWRPLHSLKRFHKYHRWQARNVYRTFPGFDTPLACSDDLKDAIVVYPEVIDGNPLRAKRVIRWLLHRPGFHTGRVNYGRDDKFFFFQQAFNDPGLNPDGDNLLRTFFVRDDIYRQVNFHPRQGSCYILRKGHNRKIEHDLQDSILTDGMSHEQMAEVFNKVKFCISYDAYTMYSMYAAMCGCVSIVVPEVGVSKEQWYPDERDRYGMAYGFDDIEHASRTQHLVLPRLKQQEHEANASVKTFLIRCQKYFG